MAGRIVLFGATGYTGGLIARRLVAAGVSPVLAGRDKARLDRLASSLDGPVTVVRADVLRQNSVFSLVEAGDVLVSTVGPFVKHGGVAARSAIAAGATYLDSTGEPAFIRRIFGEFDRPARDKGARLLTALGYDYAPGALAGALALREAGEAATRVDVGYFASGSGGASAGTMESMVGAFLEAGHAFRGGRIVSERGGAKARTFDVRGRRRSAISIGGAEHYTLPAVHPGLREVNVFLGFLPALVPAARAAGLGTSLATKVPGARAAMQLAGERLVSLLPSREGPDEGSMRSSVVGVAYDDAGTELATVTLMGGDPYAFTGAFLAWAAQRAAAGHVEGAGALSPVSAFGLDALQEGVAEAGIAVAP